MLLFFRTVRNFGNMFRMDYRMRKTYNNMTIHQSVHQYGYGPVIPVFWGRRKSSPMKTISWRTCGTVLLRNYFTYNKNKDISKKLRQCRKCLKKLEMSNFNMDNNTGKWIYSENFQNLLSAGRVISLFSGLANSRKIFPELVPRKFKRKCPYNLSPV